MSPSADAVTFTLPASLGWDFGDYPYGLEPLTLPHPGVGWMSDGTAGLDLGAAYLELLDLAHCDGLLPPPATAAELEKLFWFRWITGHQLSFVLWRLLAGHLARLETGKGDPEATAGAIVEYVRGYSAMLLYTGSSTRRIYNDTIRTSMYRLHNTFSGTWSADYPAVRSLFRGRRALPVPADHAAGLAAQVHLSHQIHLGLASKLVVDGRSLLQHAVDSPTVHQPRMWSAVFDCCFLTLRAPVTGKDVLTQLLRRCKAIFMDLAANGLYPEVADYPVALPAELQTPDVRACENDLPDIVLRMAELATEVHRL